MKFLSDEQSQTVNQSDSLIVDEEIMGETAVDGQVNSQELEGPASADELLLMAYTGIDHVIEKNKILPRASFFLEVSKQILDTLRSNSKLLDFYNDTARKVFNFCKKYRNRKEFRRISETLHSHFN